MSFDALKTAIDNVVSALDAPVAEFAQQSRQLRNSTAGLLEAAVAGAAATAAAARLEAQLALAPHVPGASGVGVAGDLLSPDVHLELTQALPAVTTVALLTSDPRALPLLLGLLARDEDIDELQLAASNAMLTGAARSVELVQLGQQLSQSLASAHLTDAAQAGPWLLALGRNEPVVEGVGGAGLRVLSGSVTRVYSAAQRGATSVLERASQLALQLQQGRLGRVFPGRSRRSISLDREYAGVVPGSYALLDRGSYRELYRVQAVATASRAEFAVQAKTSSLTLAGQGLEGFANQVRQTAAYVRSEKLERARTPIADDVAGDRFHVAADVRGMAAGRRLLIRALRSDNGQALVHAATLISATPATKAADGGLIVFTPPLPAPCRRSSVVVFGNVAQASHGETVAQVLGSGDAAQPHQRFALRHAPLTHRAGGGETGATPELTLRVGDVQWQRRDTLYGAGPTERVFTLVTDEHDQAWVQFGDGERGARLPSAANNLRASYRKGLGAEGNVRAEALSQALSRPLGFKGVSNPAPASGGSPPESADEARASLPLGTRTLGRVVSVLDYEDFARAWAGIAKAQARVLRLAHGPVVTVTVAGASQPVLTAVNPVRQQLLAAMRAQGDPHVQLRLLAMVPRWYRVGLKVRCDAAYEAAQVLAAVEAALRAQGSFAQRALGQALHASDVVAAAHAVPGVMAVDLDFLHLAGSPLALRPTLRAADTRVVAGQPAAAELLTLDPGPLARLELMP